MLRGVWIGFARHGKQFCCRSSLGRREKRFVQIKCFLDSWEAKNRQVLIGRKNGGSNDGNMVLRSCEY